MDIKVNRKDGGVAPPINLGGLFATSDDNGDESEDDSQFNNKGESQILTVGSKQLLIRQFAWHQANANQVWPGTFILANFMEKHADRYNTSLLELGSATAALTIYLRIIWTRFRRIRLLLWITWVRFPRIGLRITFWVTWIWFPRARLLLAKWLKKFFCSGCANLCLGVKLRGTYISQRQY